MSLVKVYRQVFPSSARKVAWDIWKALPWTNAGKHAKWVRETYVEFGRHQRRQIFLSAARFLHINRPIEGYYLEFGCNEANTVRMAWDAFHYLFDFTYIGFDSFEGLPEITNIDEQKIWERESWRSLKRDSSTPAFLTESPAID